MALSGVAWGCFSLLARGAQNPVETNGSTLLACLLPTVVVNALSFGEFQVTMTGVLLAIASGALATGLGYVIWYLALRELTAARAATVQLSMPAIVAAGGVVLLDEALTGRLLIALVLVIGGIAMVLVRRNHAPS